MCLFDFQLPSKGNQVEGNAIKKALFKFEFKIIFSSVR